MGELVDIRNYKRWVITQKIEELTKKLKRLPNDCIEWTQTALRIESLKKDLTDDSR